MHVYMNFLVSWPYYLMAVSCYYNRTELKSSIIFVTNKSFHLAPLHCSAKAVFNIKILFCSVSKIEGRPICRVSINGGKKNR